MLVQVAVCNLHILAKIAIVVTLLEITSSGGGHNHVGVRAGKGRIEGPNSPRNVGCKTKQTSNIHAQVLLVFASTKWPKAKIFNVKQVLKSMENSPPKKGSKPQNFI